MRVSDLLLNTAGSYMCSLAISVSSAVVQVAAGRLARAQQILSLGGTPRDHSCVTALLRCGPGDEIGTCAYVAAAHVSRSGRFGTCVRSAGAALPMGVGTISHLCLWGDSRVNDPAVPNNRGVCDVGSSADTGTRHGEPRCFDATLSRRPQMAVKTMEDLFIETLKDIYYAEKHILKALPSMVKKASSKELKKALETHRQRPKDRSIGLTRYSSCSSCRHAATSVRPSKLSSPKPKSIWRRSKTLKSSMPA